MDWHYHLVHQWETERTDWEDVWLSPSNPGYSGAYLHLTFQGSGLEEFPTGITPEVLAKLSEREMVWVDGEVVVSQPDFSKAELAGMVQRWLELNDLPVSSMTATGHERFSGRKRSEDPADIDVGDGV